MDTFHCREDDRSFLSIVHVVAAQHVANCVAGFDLKSAMRRCVMNVRFSVEGPVGWIICPLNFRSGAFFSYIPLHGAERFGFTGTLAVSLKGGPNVQNRMTV